MKKTQGKKKNGTWAAEPIAVIGMACRFPGGIHDMDRFWEVISNQACVIGSGTEARFPERGPKSRYAEKAGYLDEDPAKFDHLLFRISAAEAERMDPQQKLALKVCWEALEDAGYAPDSLEGTDTGVYAGVSATDYANNLFASPGDAYGPKDVTGTGISFLSGRVSYYFGFQGPALTIDTACSSSLVSIHEACLGLRGGDCSMALAGGVNVLYSDRSTELLSRMNILSATCELRTCDDRANGTVRGEGCGIVVLKKLSDAERDGDSIYACICGSAINQDGKSSGLTSPYGPAQEKLIARAWASAGAGTEDIRYVELHGTGTDIGDAIETASIGNVIKGREAPLYIGSVKANIGHLEAGSGVAGLMKAVLVLNHNLIPAACGFEEPSRKIAWDAYRFEMPRENIAWEEKAGQRRLAAVSSFGLSGTNAHTVLESYPAAAAARGRAPDRQRYRFRFSASDESGLRAQLEAFRGFLAEEAALDANPGRLEGIFRAHNATRPSLPWRCVVEGADAKEVIEDIDRAALGGGGVAGADRELVFLFTGQGAERAGMFSGLAKTDPFFREQYEACCRLYAERTGEDLDGIIRNAPEKLSEAKYAQPAIFAVEYAAARMFLAYGVKPSLMIGHGAGEYVAACVGGVFSLPDAISLIVARAQGMNADSKAFRDVAGRVQYQFPRVPIISNLTGRYEDKAFCGADYWVDHIHSEVKFHESIQSLSYAKDNIYLEIGASPVLLGLIRGMVGGEITGFCTGAMDREQAASDLDAVMFSLFGCGVDIDWRLYLKAQGRVRVPSYRFREEWHPQPVPAKPETPCQSTAETGQNEILGLVRDDVFEIMNMGSDQIGDDDNLLLLGLDSIILYQLVDRWADAFHFPVELAGFLENCTIHAWADLIESMIQAEGGGREEKGGPSPGFRPLPEGRFEPFGLSEVQQAYCIGRSEGVEWGGNSCYAYYEADMPDLEERRFFDAVSRLVERHDMLRATISIEGHQKVEEEIRIPYTVYRMDGIGDMDAHLAKTRDAMSSRVIPLGEPLFDLRLTQISETDWRIHFGIDFMIADAMSLQILWRDLERLYAGEDPAPLEISFRDYLQYREAKKNAPHYSQCEEYWRSRAKGFPGPPKLPVKNVDARGFRGRFQRRKRLIPKDAWKRFADCASARGLTPSSALLAIYAEVLSAWGAGERFGVMLTVFERDAVHGQVRDIVGDFTKLMLVEIERKNEPLAGNAKRLQAQILQDMAHSDYSAVRFVKDINQHCAGEPRIYPVVFTSAIGLEVDAAAMNRFYGNIGWSVSSTPQVWMDYQIYPEAGGVAISWDVLEGVFCDRVADDMFDANMQIIERLCGDAARFDDCVGDLRPERQKQEHGRANATARELPELLLHELAAAHAADPENRVAVVCRGEAYRYAQLWERSGQIAACLQSQGIAAGDKIVVQMEKSFDLIAVIFGILRAGAVYVPLLCTSPWERTRLIAEQSGSRMLITDSCLEGAGEVAFAVQTPPDFAVDTPPFAEARPSPDSLAYVIYTSGSTGAPKGVMITHKAAMNTIQDVSRLLKLSCQDRVLGLSSVSFDLSVYDIFGVLSAGGTLVLPTEAERTDPVAWRDLSMKNGVTLWNTVPALLEAYLNFLLHGGHQDLSIRHVILSGDWIPLDCFDKIRRALPNARLISMGGATEASIWSNYYEVSGIEPEWNSIPYGYPLANQQFHIFDVFGRPCPDWVEGRLFIAGKGLAEGYLNEEGLTDQSFRRVGAGKDRMYDTGDFGRYMGQGCIEFRGRKDEQVKIRGFRVELGEIEKCLSEYKGVEEAVATVVGQGGNEKRILAYYTPEEMERAEPCAPAFSEAAILRQSEILPDTITPQEYLRTSQILENMSLGIMVNTFLGFGAFDAAGPGLSVDRLVQQGKVAEKYRKLMAQWADALVQQGILERRGGGYAAVEAPGLVDIDAYLAQIKESEYYPLWQESVEYLILCNRHIAEILKADMNPLTILFQDGTTGRAENFYRYNPVAEYVNGLIASSVEEYIRQNGQGRTVSILEFGAGTGGTTAAVLEKVKGYSVRYTFTDISTFFTHQAEEKFKGFECMEYKLYNIDLYPQVQGFPLGSYDIVIGANVLHDAKILDATLGHLRSLLSDGGMLAILELTQNKLYYKVSIGLIEGFSGYEDERLLTNDVLLDAPQWKRKMEGQGFDRVRYFPADGAPAACFDQHVVLAFANKRVRYIPEIELKGYLAQKLPAYMVPSHIFPIDAIPLNQNGKVDRKALPLPQLGAEGAPLKEPATETEKTMCRIFADVLKVDRIGVGANLFEIGGDSLKTIEIVSRLKEAGITVSLSDVYERPEIESLAALVDSRGGGAAIQEDMSAFRVQPQQTDQAFPLGAIQAAYLLGRRGGFALGNTSCHYYAEVESSMDIETLQRGLNLVIARQPALRTVVYPEGAQQVLREAPPYTIEVEDISAMSSYAQDLRIKEFRGAASHRLFDLGKWPLFRIYAMKLSEGRHLLFIDIDVMIADAASFFIFSGELLHCSRTDEPLPGFDFHMADYLASLRAFQESDTYARHRDYWQSRAPGFPAPISLPVLTDIDRVRQPVFRRLQAAFDRGRWDRIKRAAAENNVTPASLICAAYCRILSEYCNEEHYCINITMFNRLGFYEHLNEFMGDFTSTVIFEVMMEKGLDFWGQARAVQKQFAADLDHRYYDGIEFLKDLRRQAGGAEQAFVPAVFTCAIFDEDVAGWEDFGELKYAISQTPQILLDNQVTVLGGKLTIAWDFVENAMDPALVRSMFDAFVALLDGICERGSDFDGIAPKPPAQLLAGGEAAPEGLLSGKVEGLLRSRNGAPYVVDSSVLFCAAESVGELLQEAQAEAHFGCQDIHTVVLYGNGIQGSQAEQVRLHFIHADIFVIPEIPGVDPPALYYPVAQINTAEPLPAGGYPFHAESMQIRNYLGSVCAIGVKGHLHCMKKSAGGQEEEADWVDAGVEAVYEKDGMIRILSALEDREKVMN